MKMFNVGSIKVLNQIKIFHFANGEDVDIMRKSY